MNARAGGCLCETRRFNAAKDTHEQLCGRPEEQDEADRVAPNVPGGIEPNRTERTEPSRAETNHTGLSPAEPVAPLARSWFH